MQRQRVLLMTDKQTICPDELKTNGILTVHESPNKLLITRRAKVNGRANGMFFFPVATHLLESYCLWVCQ